MKLIREIDTKKVIYLVNDGETITIGEDFSTIGDMKILDIISTTHEVVENVEAPDLFVSGAVSYNGEWSIINDEAVSNALSKLSNEFTIQVDKDVDAIIKAFIGERAIEYLRAEEEAKAFKAAKYTGDVPDSVNADVVAKGMTPEEATNSIIAATTEWRRIQSEIRLNRLTAKANALKAKTKSELDAVKSTWFQFNTNTKKELGLEPEYPFGR